jgi:8-oxo-dGTP diphosphatase
VTIVGAAILDAAGRVLGAARADPPELAGWWEFPGGKVEAGEDERAALVRECREELGVTIRVGARIGPDVEVTLAGRPRDGAGRAVLRVWLATIVDGRRPRALEHAELRWLRQDELDAVPWLPADAPLVDALREHLAPPAGAGAG